MLVVFVVLMLSDLFAIPQLGYADELAGIFFVLLSFWYLLLKKSIKKAYFYIFICMIGIMGVGFLGNIINPIQQHISTVLLGSFLVIKQYFYGFFVLLSATKDKSDKILFSITRISKIMLVALCILACINEIIGIGMTGPNGGFSFVAHFGGTVSCWVILFLAVCYSDSTSNRIVWFALASIIIIFTESGLGRLGIGLLVLVYLFLEKETKFKWYYIIPIVLVAVLLSWQEISQYLLDSTAPRARLLVYAFVTANKYFPIGSGFSTYGSSMAASHYSKLYTLYGFNRQFGMSEDTSSFLMDSYYPMIIGETGYLGMVLFGILIYYYLVKVIIRTKDIWKKNSALYLFGFLLIAGLGFGTGSDWGCAVYMVVPLLVKQGSIIIKQNESVRIVQKNIRVKSTLYR